MWNAGSPDGTSEAIEIGRRTIGRMFDSPILTAEELASIRRPYRAARLLPRLGAGTVPAARLGDRRPGGRGARARHVFHDGARRRAAPRRAGARRPAPGLLQRLPAPRDGCRRGALW